MTKNKTVAERLRGASEKSPGTPWCKIQKELGFACGDFKGCDECHQAMHIALADIIEVEQAELRKQSGVDVDALLKVADELDIPKDSYALYMDKASAHRKRDIIRDAVKDAKPQLPEGVIWPRFEDGELVKPFDKLPGFDSGGVQKFIWTSSHNGAWQLQDAEGHMLNVMHGETAKRPEPEVLDADGVPIKAGDTIYDIETGTAILIDYIDNGYACADSLHLHPKNLTHRKPDTQEAIEEDAAKDPCAYFNGRTPDKCADCKLHDGDPEFDFEANFNDCRTAMNRDLLARQRKLLGGE